MDLFRPRVRPEAERVATLKRWVASALELPESTSVLVTELACSEPGCPPLETVIAVLTEHGASDRRQHTFHKALNEVTWADVAELASRWPPAK